MYPWRVRDAFQPIPALASTTHILELAESNADALDPETAKTIAGFLGPLFAISEILFIVRIVMTWYPSVPITKLPWVVAYVLDGAFVETNEDGDTAGWRRGCFAYRLGWGDFVF